MKYVIALALIVAACHAALTAHTDVKPHEDLYNLVWDHSGQTFILDHDLTLEDCTNMMQARMGCERMK